LSLFRKQVRRELMFATLSLFASGPISLASSVIQMQIFLRSEYCFVFNFHKHSSFLYISMKFERNSGGMVRKSNMIHAVQSKVWEELEREAHTLQLAWRLACTLLENQELTALLEATPRTARVR
jgi:hypothetical protein